MADDSCPFCAIVAGRAPAHRVLDDGVAVAFLDARPLFPGHVLVVPRRHHPTLADLPPGDLGPLLERVQRIEGAVRAATGAAGTFVAMNNTVSQSVPHLHVHVVPRNRGDGLRGFFWPRHGYDDETHAAAVARAVRDALDPSEDPNPGTRSGADG